jgi:hypothetical protein
MLPIEKSKSDYGIEDTKETTKPKMKCNKESTKPGIKCNKESTKPGIKCNVVTASVTAARAPATVLLQGLAECGSAWVPLPQDP